MRLAELAWPDAEAAEADLAVLPVGSTEQHGPHAPLGTDWLTAEAVASAAAAAADRPVVVAPTIPIGVAAEHRAFAGTLWVSPDTFRAYVRETIASLAHHGWDRVVVVNGHGGNVEALAECCGEISRDGPAYAVPFTYFETLDPQAAGFDEGVEMSHAGPIETSLIRHLRPDLVREGRFEEAARDSADRWGEWVSGVNLAVESAEFAENGTVGDPRASDPEGGEALLAQATDALVALLTAVADRDR